MESVALLDLDLQVAALNRQLLAVNAQGIAPPSPDEQARIAATALDRQLANFNPEVSLQNALSLRRPDNFRDRAHNQDALEHFLVGGDKVAVVAGGPLMGKSHLVTEVLARRAYSRQAIVIDLQVTSSVWNVLEQYLSGLGAAVSFEVMAGFRNLSFHQFQGGIEDVVNRSAPFCVLVFDHFERILKAGDTTIADPETERLIQLLVTAEKAKVVITSSIDPKLPFMDTIDAVRARQPIVGRFPEGKHVENVLDDFVNRAAIGLSNYPTELLEGIDRYPYLAALAGRIIGKEGAGALDDKIFLSQVRNRLRSELLRRIIDETARPAAELLSIVRIPIPRDMFEALAGAESVRR